MDDFDDPMLLSLVMGAAVDAIIITDSSGRILRANRAAEQMFQRPQGTLIAANVNVLMPDDVANRHDAFVENHLASGACTIVGTSRDVLGLKADGTRIPLTISVGRADTEQGVAFVSIMSDQSERQAMREAAERSIRMDAIGRMTGGISHDFNNLLTVIIGNLELLETSGLSDRQATFAADALAAAALGADLSSRLTSFARSADLRADPVIDVNVQVEHSLALLRHTIGSHCEITSLPTPDLWPVAADKVQLQTAILNIAMNSQDAMRDGGTITIETQNINIDDRYVAQELDVAPGRYVRLSISDTGKGMTAEERTHALEPFFSTKSAGHGTGLGLSMVYGFVKKSGGHITIYSEPGDGTTVALYFPAIDQDASPAPEVERHGAQGGQGRARGTILIVEDDAKLRRLTQTRLTALGFDCIAAGDADAAWKILSDGTEIALVFTDMVMPGKMSGYDLALRITQERPGIAVLLTSGFSESVLKNRRIGTEFKMLRKPYRQQDLEAAVYTVLDRG